MTQGHNKSYTRGGIEEDSIEEALYSVESKLIGDDSEWCDRYKQEGGDGGAE